jgi:hypothetical protein
VTAWQLEDITGRTDQTTPSEYGSVGVYDNFGTTNLFSGDVADFNAAGWSRGGLTASGNTVTFGANTDQLSCPVRGVPVNSVPPVTGNTYVLQFTVSATASIASVGFEIVDVADGIPSFVKVVTVTTTPTAHSVLCVMPSTMSSSGPQFWVNRTSIMTGAAGQTMTITGLRYVDISAYHGAGVDGVKYFNTDLTGAAIPAATNLGYLAEAAATNLCLQSNSLTTAPWANQVGTCTPTQNAIGLDGATSAWTLTDNDAGVTETYGELIGGLTAVSYTASIFVAKTSGAQSSYPVIVIYDGTALRLALATVDTTNGVATIWTSYTGWTTIGTATCVSHNSNFWRVAITFTASTNAWVLNLVPAGSLTATLAGPAYNVTAQGSAVFYGAQVELGSVATSYIPTTTVAVTRNADILTYPSAGNIDGTVGWCSAEASTIEASSGQSAIVGVRAAGAVLQMLSTATTISSDDGSVSVTKTGLTSMQTGQRKRASSWGTDGQLITGDGATPSSGAFDGDHSPVNIAIGSGTSGGIHWNGNIRNVRIGQRQLSSSELQAVTR